MAAPVVALALVVAACGSGDEGGSDPESAATQGGRSAFEDESRSQRDDDVGDGDGDIRDQDSSDNGSGAGGESQSIDVDLQQRHPNGTVLRVLGVTVASTSTGVEVEALNGFTEQISLNARGVHLVDDLGNAYNFVAPEQNSDMKVNPGEVLSGTLTFLGRIEKEATSLRLLINTYNADDVVDLAARYDRSTSPEFQIDDIPLPGR